MNVLPPPDLRHRRSYRWLFPVVRWLVGRVVAWYGPVRQRDPQHVPATGPVLVVANHLSDVDPIVIQVGSRRGLHFMAKEELFQMPFLGPFIRWCGTFPVRRGTPDRPAIRHALELLRAGEAVAIFPEGQLSETGTRQPLLPGVALLVRGSQAPVVVAAVIGTPRMMPYGQTRPRRARGGVTVAWSEPIRFDPDASTDEIVRTLDDTLTRLGAP